MLMLGDSKHKFIGSKKELKDAQYSHEVHTLWG